MRVWLLTVGEPLPIQSGRPRLHRCGILANVLAEQGVEVVWWTGNFLHAEKTKLFPQTTAVEYSRNIKLWCLDSRPYSNVSLQRILANREVAAEFRRLANSEPEPDVVVASYPIPELAEAGADYARSRGIPTYVDVRDLWPDVWSTIAPAPLRPATDLLLLPFYRQSRRVLRRFDNICGITDEVLAWGLDRAGRTPRPGDIAIPHGYAVPQHSEAELAEARTFWSTLLGSRPVPDLRLCYFGNIALERARLDVMVQAIKDLPASARNRVQLVICGTGESLDLLKKKTADVPQIVVAGWINSPQIQVVASAAHAGVLTYPSSMDFRKSIPNKVIEYLAYGLPVLTSLSGAVSSLITGEKCGVIYRETDSRDLARVIVELLNDRTRLNSLSDNARQTFRDRFQASAVYGEYAGRITDLGRRARKRPSGHECHI